MCFNKMAKRKVPPCDDTGENGIGELAVEIKQEFASKNFETPVKLVKIQEAVGNALLNGSTVALEKKMASSIVTPVKKQNLVYVVLVKPTMTPHEFETEEDRNIFFDAAIECGVDGCNLVKKEFGTTENLASFIRGLEVFTTGQDLDKKPSAVVQVIRSESNGNPAPPAIGKNVLDSNLVPKFQGKAYYPGMEDEDPVVNPVHRDPPNPNPILMENPVRQDGPHNNPILMPVPQAGFRAARSFNEILESYNHADPQVMVEIHLFDDIPPGATCHPIVIEIYDTKYNFTHWCHGSMAFQKTLDLFNKLEPGDMSQISVRPNSLSQYMSPCKMTDFNGNPIVKSSEKGWKNWREGLYSYIARVENPRAIEEQVIATVTDLFNVLFEPGPFRNVYSKFKAGNSTSPSVLSAVGTTAHHNVQEDGHFFSTVIDALNRVQITYHDNLKQVVDQDTRSRIMEKMYHIRHSRNLSGALKRFSENE